MMNLKKATIVVLLTALSVLLVGTVVAQDTVTSADRTITVTGYGEAAGSPDIAYVQLGVEASGADVVSTFDEVNSKMQNVLDALREAGIEDRDLQTTGLYIYQETGINPETGMRSDNVTYRAGNNVVVTIRDISRVGEIISVGVEAGANSINSLNFGLDDTVALEQEALAAAVENARTRAAELAELMGVTLGEPLTIVEGGLNNTPIPFERAQAGFALDSSVPVAQGQLTVPVQVRVTFAIS